MPKKKGGMDFRYDTGPSRIPWAAVGELVREDDVLEILRFLLPPGDAKSAEYRKRFGRVADAVRGLKTCGKHAGKLTLGDNVKALEAEVAKLLGAKHALFVTNATAGFEIAYKFAGLKPGDEVIAPAITFIATIVYPLSIGAKVVLADVDPHTVNMDPKDVARKITPRTKVIIPVHIGGYPVDMDPIMRLAKKHNITVIEDAAHGFGASYKGRKLGTIGHFGAFSFHEVKNITSLGEGGILVTNLPCGKDFSKARFVGVDLSRKIKNWLYDVVALRGRGKWFAPGNHSATELQALGLRLQLKRLAGVVEKRRFATNYLNQRLGKVDGIVTPPSDSAKVRPAHHLYLLQIDPVKAGGDVQQLQKKLAARGVTNIPHFAPLYKFSIMRQLGYDTKKIEKTCPVAEEMFNRRFTHLPLYEFNKSDLDYMAKAVIESVKEMQNG